MKIILDKVILRCPEPKDVQYLYEYKNNGIIINRLGGFSFGYAIQDIHDWIEYHRNKADEIIWVIAEKDNDICLGHIGLYKIDHRVRSAEFALMLGNMEWWGRGVGKGVSHAVIDYGFRQLNLHRIYFSVLETNERSINLYKKMGFITEGSLRDEQFREGRFVDVIIMSMLEDEWQKI